MNNLTPLLLLTLLLSSLSLPAAEILGQVIDEDTRHPIQSALVSVDADPADGTPEFTTRTDAFGFYSFTNLDDDTTYELTASHPAYTSQTTTATATDAEKTTRTFAFDLGTGPLPYFSMELIEGARSVTGFAEHRQLALRDRVELFAQVCEAVHHGHTKGVIHRDLKPSNILVNREGHPKIIDFGVARAADAEQTPSSLNTRTGQLVGTLQYMSPEQCRADPHAIDIRSDIYALGVILYELLAGKLPYSVTSVPALEAARVVCEELPRRPSTADTALRGDIETILLKALEKEPERRYQSALEFAKDLTHFLRGEAIRARPPSTFYQLSVFARRNKVLVAGVLGVIVALSVGLVIASQQRDAALEAQRERSRLSNVVVVRTLEREFDELWPRTPEMAARYRSWLDRHAEMAGRRAVHEAFRDQLRERELMRQVRAGLVETDATGPEWEHAKESTRFDRATALEILDTLERLEDRAPEIENRLEFAANIEKWSIHDHAELWEEAISDIALMPEYADENGALEISPQLGLVPLEPSEESGLWEFWYVDSGPRPERNPATGQWITEQEGMVFVLIPGGTFWMGTPGQEPDAVHEVTLDPFFLSKYEMTRAQWRRAMGVPVGLGREPNPFGQTAQDPADGMTWDQAHTILWRVGLEIPTEAQWEYACRAGTTTKYATGDEPSSLQGYANISDSSREELSISRRTMEVNDGFTSWSPVGSFLPNAFGLHDMLGNVMEWCRDQHFVYDGTTVRREDGLREREGIRYYRNPPSFRVTRGGTWLRPAEEAASAKRTSSDRASGLYFVGLRPSRLVHWD